MNHISLQPDSEIVDLAMHIDIAEAITNKLKEFDNPVGFHCAGGYLYAESFHGVDQYMPEARRIARTMAQDFSLVRYKPSGEARLVASVYIGSGRPDNYNAHVYETEPGDGYAGRYVVQYSKPGQPIISYVECDTWADARLAVRCGEALNGTMVPDEDDE